ncbi:MAG: hypothetical protein RLQ12_18725 [Cyclobacteriaceae bacterium]
MKILMITSMVPFAGTHIRDILLKGTETHHKSSHLHFGANG